MPWAIGFGKPRLEEVVELAQALGRIDPGRVVVEIVER
jgi:hypothetical protein